MSGDGEGHARLLDVLPHPVTRGEPVVTDRA